MRILIASVIAVAVGACSQSPPATQPEEFDTVDATKVDPGVAPGALGNQSVNYGEGATTPAEQNNMGNTLRSQEQPSSGNAQQ